MTRTHYDVMRDVGEGWGFKKEFIQSLMVTRTEYKDKHPLAYAFGAEVEPTGRYFCGWCDGYLREQACDGYEERIRGTLKREIIDEYIQPTCPECHTTIESKKQVEVMVSEPTICWGPDEIPDPPDTEVKTAYRPCGHRFEIGEELIRWDLDRGQLQRDVDDGQYRYNGQVFRRVV